MSGVPGLGPIAVPAASRGRSASASDSGRSRPRAIAGLSADLSVSGSGAPGAPKVTGVSARTRAMSVDSGSSASSLKGVSATVSLGGPAAATAAKTHIAIQGVRRTPERGANFLFSTFQGVVRVHQLSQEEQAEMDDYIDEVQRLCIEEKVVGSDVQGFSVSVNSGEISFNGPSGDTVNKSIIPEMKRNPDLEKAVANLKDFRDRKLGFSRPTYHAYSPDSKGDTNGVTPHGRLTPASQKYPRSVKTSVRPALQLLSEKHPTDPIQHRAAVTRMACSGLYHEPVKEKLVELQKDATGRLDAAKKQLEQQRKDGKPQSDIASTQSTIEETQTEVNKLNAAIARVDQFDPYANSAALAFYPAIADPSPTDIGERAEQVRSAIDAKHKKDHDVWVEGQKHWTPWQTWWRVAVHGQPGEHYPEVLFDTNYASSVGGLFFKEFGRYHDYCVNVGMRPQAEGFDKFFRTMVNFDGMTNADVNAAITSYLTQDLEGLTTAQTAVTGLIDTATTKARAISDKAKAVSDADFHAYGATLEERVAKFTETIEKP